MAHGVLLFAERTIYYIRIEIRLQSESFSGSRYTIVDHPSKHQSSTQKGLLCNTISCRLTTKKQRYLSFLKVYYRHSPDGQMS